MGIKLIVLFFFILNIAIDFLLQKEARKQLGKVAQYYYCAISLFISVSMLLVALMPIEIAGLHMFMWVMFAFLSCFLAKVVFLLFFILGYAFKLILKQGALKKMFNILGLTAGSILFCVMWYGALVTAQNPVVNVVEIDCDNLPESFNGIKLVHISDFHIGSFGEGSSFIRKVVDEINSVEPDAVLFTGDLVNSQAREVLPYVDELSQIKSKYGVFSVLGNHDYGDYYKWDTDELKRKNLAMLNELQHKSGWILLNNEHAVLNNGNDSLVVIGVENWGDPPFPKYGNLRKSYPNLNDSRFKLLLSHNPVHWKAHVLKESNVDLTLSGHTHAMQMEFSMSGASWSPAELRYTEWGGLYENDGRYLYVNRGLGFVGIPMRIGASPEITLLILNRKEYD